MSAMDNEDGAMDGGQDEKQSPPDVLYADIDADSQAPTQIESLCVNCGQNGVTTLLLTKIPFYKEVILMSFRCENCGFTNCELQSGSKIQERGVTYKVKVKDREDLNLQIVKSDTATLKVPELDLEVPADSQKGVVTTVEGVLQRTIDGLMQDQPVRKHMAPQDAKKIEEYVARIEDLLEANSTFHVILSDPSGNSFVQNRHAPEIDPDREVTHFARTREQDHSLGLYTQEEVAEATDARLDTVATEAPLASTSEVSTRSTATPTADAVLLSGQAQLEATEVSQKLVEERANRLVHGGEDNLTSTNELDLESEVLVFHTNCPECNAPCKTNMKVTKIPHFKEVVIMATLCDSCGHKTNEVKSGGGIEPTGKKMTLTVKGHIDPAQTEEDLSRDILKAETCSIAIPELKFEMGGFALGGRFTTLEGLLTNIDEQVADNPFLGALATGDSASNKDKMKMEEFRAKLGRLKAGQEPFTLVLDDPAGNSYLQDLYLPDKDPRLSVERYKRTFEQDEELGLNDIKTENYQENLQSSAD